MSDAQVAASREAYKPKNADILEWSLISLALPQVGRLHHVSHRSTEVAALAPPSHTDSLVGPMPPQISLVGHLGYPEYDLGLLGVIHLWCLNDLLLWLPPYKGIERAGSHDMYSVTYAVLGLYHEGV